MRQGGAAVPQQRVAHRQRAGPTGLFPGLEGNAQNPARPLAHGRLERVGKWFADGNDLVDGLRGCKGTVTPPAPDDAINRIAHHARAKTGPLDPNADLIIFRQVADQERFAMVRRSQMFQGLAGKGRSDPRRGHDAANALANENVFGVQFGEAVDVGVSRPILPHGHLEREHGQLRHIVLARNKIIVNLERQGMDDILGIVNGDDGILPYPGHLIQPHVPVDPIQAVGFAGGARMGDHHFVDARVFDADPVHAADRLGVIGIDTDENVVLLVKHDPRCIFRHLVNDSSLLPGGDAERDPLLRRELQTLE